MESGRQHRRYALPTTFTPGRYDPPRAFRTSPLRRFSIRSSIRRRAAVELMLGKAAPHQESLELIRAAAEEVK
ncbi:hypothetical protein Apa02nite_096530 [Actinoplanes palleronii]|uniref:Uncharacterized protein n=1 Tax=Actinoplanes palleronii TaxID=113570 RepID=A0ABQ4BSD0_9ACTN|nr:hypothetical protein Apa02nite_096530 [Actinoplanes palleronii]